MSVLNEELQDILDDLEDAEDIVDDDPGPLPEPPRSSVATLLTSAESHCNTALATGDLSSYTGQDQNTYPSTPNLPSIAGDCTMLAAYAVDEEINRNSGWQQRCCNHLVTIKRLITMDDGYRDRAGIT
jgi:hypothetical protein